MIIDSWGGGTQSIAIAVLSITGRLPKPDHIVFADTGREASETMEYYYKYLEKLFVKEKLKFHIAGHHLSTVDLYGKNGDLLIPAFTKTGKLPTFCSNEWKSRVIKRFVKKQLQIKKCRMWIGFSVDELERMKDSDVKWITKEYPLIEKGITREDCISIVEEFGLPTPPRSSCWMCPHRTNEEWLRLRKHYPLDFGKAVHLEKTANINDEIYLHRDLIYLDNNQFEKKNKRETSCQEGICFT